MASYALSALLALASSTLVTAQVPTIEPTPLASLNFASPADLPYQVEPNPVVRGSQFGFNQCNSTTQNQQSLCQTMYVNSIDDFCLWGPDKPNSTISDTEGEEVAWCTKPHGARLIPNGALQGVQFLKAPDYILVAGFIDQTQVNIQDGDFGGELDPHGQDLAGNPMGGIVFSNAYSGSNTTYQQMVEWNLFIGGNQFCLKICPTGAPGNNPAGYCRNTLDRLGCSVNSPNNAQKDVYEVCDSADMDLPGVYVSNGQTITYTQPPESLGAITSIPFTATVPASSNCTPFSSAALYTDIASVSGASTTPAASATPSGSGSVSGSAKPTSGSATGSHSASAAGSSSTSTPNGAGAFGVSLVAGVIGVAFSVAFLA
ncbi:hypothetical protein FA95DRAFT_1497801 [Auriscalpium vulgare]|uniref:Uncharacterized protein n=1 Tax=Auriscalpium vulgare TaxID=40419 RepID=A0ACB8RJA6_9AGAM|nr:hypothetical protein FA95DRAFT_1497801 [Auriscalpium vulgare]